MRSKEERDRLVEAKIIREEGEVAARWEMEAKRELLESGLEQRPNLDTLKDRGVYQVI